jgi:hypothetical protein
MADSDRNVSGGSKRSIRRYARGRPRADVASDRAVSALAAIPARNRSQNATRGNATARLDPISLHKKERIMRISLKAVSSVFALSIILSVAVVARAGPKDDVAASAQAWAHALDAVQQKDVLRKIYPLSRARRCRLPSPIF